MSLSCILAVAQNDKLEYAQHLTISEGLAHNGVTAILEDSKGFIWISTYDGLNKYDGYEFTTYKNSIDEDFFVSNRIRTINENKEGDIWIGTDEGITVYSCITQRFKGVYSSKLANKEVKGPIVRKIVFGEGAVLCSTEDAGVLVFSYKYDLLAQYKQEDENNQNISFYDFVKLDELNYFFTSSDGLYHFNLKNGKFTSIAQDLVFDSNNKIKNVGNNTLVFSMLYGISFIKFDSINGSYTFTKLSTRLQDYQVRSLSVDELGNLWLGTAQDGIIHIDSFNDLLNDQPFKQKYFTVPNNLLRVSCVNSGINSDCWVGTFNKGIYRFNLKENPFKRYNTAMNFTYGLQSNHVMYISPLDKNRVYISANRGGVSLFNTQTHKFEPLPFKLPADYQDMAGVVFVDSRGDTWLKLGAGGSLYRGQKGKSHLKKIELENSYQINGLAANSIIEDKQGNIWLGGEGNIIKINISNTGIIGSIETLKDNPFFEKLKEPIIRRLYVDPVHDFIWVGTDFDGLFRIKTKGNEPLKELVIGHYINDKNNPRSLSSNFVTSIVRLPNDELWLGTEGGGICKVLSSDKEPVFVPYTEKQGLSNNVVKNVWFDDEYNLWVSTNIGLNKFDTKNLRFRIFEKEDGLPFEDFWYSTSKLKNGKFIISGLDGFCYFDPREVSNSEELPRLEFGNLRLANNIIRPGDTIGERVLMQRCLSDMEEIILKHNENVLTVELISLHYSNIDNHFLKYQLSPVNETWIEVPSSRRYLNYNGLQPGEYVLKVMASNSLSQWTEPKQLKIKILPPFWRTTKAYIIYFIVLGIIVYVVIFFFFRIQNLKYNLKIEQIEKDKVKEVNAAKLRFFSNISHEIKTPITLIAGPVALLMERFKNNTEINDKLQIIQRQSKKISQLVDQVHDFQRADANLLKMNFSRFSFDDFIHELMIDFEFKAKNEKKKFIGQGEESKIFVQADRDKLEKLFNNILNNAFKYTRPNDTIRIDYSHEGNDLVVTIKDTGKGIDEEDLPHIFERFYQSKKRHSAYTGGSGIGLAFTKRLVEMHYGYIHAESELNKGTSLVVRLPIVKPDLHDDQQEKEQEILSVEKYFAVRHSFVEESDISQIKVGEEYSGATVFLAEDNTEMRLFIEGVLSDFFKVKSFSNGKECLDAMDNEWPDIVISDVLMPELNGFELCKNIKSSIKTSHIPIILLTACTTIDDQLQGIKDGADVYIKKPFNIEHLITRTETLLKGRKQLRERFQNDFPLTLKKSNESSKDIAFLEKLYNLMEENLDNLEVDLDRFAKELYLNRTHFYQKVKTLTNETPYELLKAFKLKKAAEFLVQDGVSINEVVTMTGFKSRAHFSKLFKEKYNIPPGKFIAEAVSKNK